MGFDYLIAVIFFAANQVDLVAVKFSPQTRLEEFKFLDNIDSSKKFIDSLEHFSKQSKKFRVCVVQRDSEFESPIAELIRPLFLDREAEFPAIYSSYENVNTYTKNVTASTPSPEQVMAYCIGTIPRALP